MSANYGEIICNAVDEIVSARLQGLQYDITRLCTVVNDSESYQGKYTVSDGTAKYDAFSSDTSFKTGNQVLVVIPNGDYSLQKTITGRVATTDSTPFNYTPPLDAMIKITNNVFESAKTQQSENLGLLANGDQETALIYTLKEEDKLAGYTRLGISANFRSWLSAFDVFSGTYGIRVSLVGADGNQYIMDFSSADMIGNPYQFEDYFYQEKCFDVSMISNIKSLEVSFFQSKNFIDGTGSSIASKDDLGNDLPNNLFVNDIKIYLGYEADKFTEETLMLYTPNSYTYSSAEEDYKEISLRWIHKIDDKTFELIDKENFDDTKYKVQWYRYNPRVVGDNIQYAGQFWEEISGAENKFQWFLSPDTSLQQEQIKVICSIGEGERYYSPLLTFENEITVPDSVTLDAASALSIVCADGSEGNYFFYDTSGRIISEGNGKGNLRIFKIYYHGAAVDDEEISSITWYLPSGDNSMLVLDGTYEEKEKEDFASYRGQDYIAVTRSKNSEQQYSIANYWNSNMTNNTIVCKAVYKGVECQAVKELTFGKAGTNGTSMTFLIDFAGNQNAFIDGSAGITISPTLYLDSSGKESGIPEGCSIKWEWYSNSEYLTFEEEGTSVIVKKVENSYAEIPADNRHILKATLTGLGSTSLEAYLPIPIKDKDYSHIEGARQVIYNTMGVPDYYKDAYVLYDTNNKEIKENIVWDINNVVDTVYASTLKDHATRKGYKALNASPFYIDDSSNTPCVYVKVDGKTVWSQPILIMQSRYDIASLNNWDGKLSVDEGNNTILSAVLGAGRKSGNNTFSGVLMGNVGNDNSSSTGVYGFNDGAMVYALKDDGTATFGKKSTGQIIINGNSGTIQSAGFLENPNSPTGMKINLQEGSLDIANKGNSIVSLNSGVSYLQVKDDNKNTLINIADDDYYLQSANYDGKSGTHLDIESGSFYVGNNLIGSIKLSPEDTLVSIKNTSAELLHIGKDKYYLQSSGFNGVYQVIDNTNYYKYQNSEEYQNGNNTYKSGTVFYLKDNNTATVYNSSFNALSFISRTVEENGIEETYSAESEKMRLIASFVPVLNSGDASGLKIDLGEGSIVGYDLYLSGSSGGNNLIIDTTEKNYPLRIGKNFKVGWDGTVYCNEVSALKSTQASGQIININNNFTVSAGGGTYASSLSAGAFYLNGQRYTPTTISSGQTILTASS